MSAPGNESLRRRHNGSRRREREAQILDASRSTRPSTATHAILKRTGNNQSAAARALGISRNKLARLLRG